MPQYWLMDSIENTNVFPNVLVLGADDIDIIYCGKL